MNFAQFVASKSEAICNAGESAIAEKSPVSSKGAISVETSVRGKVDSNEGDNGADG